MMRLLGCALAMIGLSWGAVGDASAQTTTVAQTPIMAMTAGLTSWQIHKEVVSQRGASFRSSTDMVQCLNLQAPQKPMPPSSNTTCSNMDVHFGATNVAMHFECVSQRLGNMSFHFDVMTRDRGRTASMRYLTSIQNLPIKGVPSTVVTRVTGRYLGPCAPGALPDQPSAAAQYSDAERMILGRNR